MVKGIQELWYSNDEMVWTNALKSYWRYVKPNNLDLEREMDELDVERIEQLDEFSWYSFLKEKYFRWKYTAPNRYVTTVNLLSQYEKTSTLDQLYQVKLDLFSLDKTNIRNGLEVASMVKGLGTAGASGLLAVLFPNYFGTVDQFVAIALSKLNEFDRLKKVKPESLSISNGVDLINILREKSYDNNRLFSTDFWTPRKIDMVLWACRS